MDHHSGEHGQLDPSHGTRPDAAIPGLGLIVVAAGSSSRMGGVDKIWAALGATNVLMHSVAELAPCAEQTVVVVGRNSQSRAREELSMFAGNIRVVEGGQRRQDSVLSGLDALSGVHMVAVHDGARPFATQMLLNRGVAALHQYDGVVPGTTVTDTVKQVDHSGRVVHTVDRSVLRMVQTPQVFYKDVLLRCHRSTDLVNTGVTDDAALLEACNYRVGVYPGEIGNFKITTALDLELARLLVRLDTDT